MQVCQFVRLPAHYRSFFLLGYVATVGLFLSLQCSWWHLVNPAQALTFALTLFALTARIAYNNRGLLVGATVLMLTQVAVSMQTMSTVTLPVSDLQRWYWQGIISVQAAILLWFLAVLGTQPRVRHDRVSAALIWSFISSQALVLLLVWGPVWDRCFGVCGVQV